MKKKDYLYNAYKVVKNQPACDLPQCNWDYLEITYKAGKGHFKVLFYNLVCVFPITDYKKVISLLNEDNEGFDKANELHKIFVQMSEKLLDLKSKTNKADEKTEIQDSLNRLVKLNDVLIDSFAGIEEIQAEKTIKLNTEPCYKMIYDNGKKQLVVDYKAKSFIKFGYKFFISSDSKIRGLKHIIIPSHGLSCCDFHGTFKQAIEYIDNELIDKVLKALEKTDNADFLQLLNEHDITRIPDFIITDNDSISVVNAIAEKQDASIEDFYKQFSFDYDLIYEAQINNCNFKIHDKVDLFDSSMDILKPIITVFNQYRQDIISSDRECAAFIMAIDFFIKTNKKTIAGFDIPELAIA